MGHRRTRDFVSAAFGVALAVQSAELTVIRAAFFLTLALTFGVTNSAALFCQSWCDRVPVAAGDDECRHNESTTQIALTGGIDCASIGLPATPVIRVAPTRSATPSDYDTAVDPPNNAPAVTARYAAATGDARLITDSTPRVIALRI